MSVSAPRKTPPITINSILGKTVRDLLLDNFSQWEVRARQVNKFFDQEYFKGDESLMKELLKKNPDISFDHIKDEWINLWDLLYNKRMRDFGWCMNKITNTEIKKILMNEIHDRIQNELGWAEVYWDFSEKCNVPWNENVLSYFQDIVNYLNNKEWKEWAKKTKDILENITITNGDINWKLTSNPIPTDVVLSNTSIPEDTKNSFDAILSFEIGEKASYILNRVDEISEQIWWLFTNSLPAINTIVWESSKYKYDESKLWAEYKKELKEIQNDSNINEQDKIKKINDLKWKHYLSYLKLKNEKIFEALKALYNNNFDYSKLDHDLLKWYLDVVVDERLDKLLSPWNWTNEILKLNFWNLDKFKQFYKDLANPDIWEFTLEKATSVNWDSPLKIPVEKTIIEWENLRLKDINQFWWNPLSYDAIPIRYTIKKSDIDALKHNLNIEDIAKLEWFLSTFKYEDDKYIIEWDKVWMLIYLFFVLNNETSITEFNPEDQKKIEDLFWRAKETDGNNINDNTWEDNTWEDNAWEDNPSENNPSENENNTWEPESSTNKWEDNNTSDTKENIVANFKEQIESKFKWPWKFENGSEIIIPAFNGELPWWKYDHLKLRIENIDNKKWTFKCRALGCELKLKDNLEWKTKEFHMNQWFFDDINKISKNSNVWLLPNPNKWNFNSHLKNFNNEDWKNDLGFPGEWVTRDKSKFMRKFVDNNWEERNEEVKYFWVPDDDKATYKVEYNPIKNSFRVSSVFNGQEKWKDWKTETKRFSYKRDMDWNTFLIFFNQRWLFPQSEEDSKNAVQASEADYKIENGWHWKLNWFSFINVKNWLKDIFGNLNKKIDEYNQQRTDKFKDITQDNILNFISKFPLPNSLKYAVWELQKESYNGKVNGARKEIEWYLEDFKKDNQFADTFDQLPSSVQTTYWKSYKNFLKDLFKKKWKTSETDKRKAAALLLANIQCWWSPYRGLTEYENKWLWVKTILWNKHYEIFMATKQKFIREKLKNAWKNKDQLQSVLATCEMDYIINNVTWANWKLPFWCKEIRWIPGKKNTNYWPNPSKIILSEKFGNELKSSYQWWFNKSSIEEAYWKISHNDFEQAQVDFYRLFKSSRFPWALGNLKKMFDLAKDDEQKTEYQKCFLVYLLSGVLDVYGKKDLRKQAYLWAKTMFFLPWMLAKNTWHSEQVAVLLDDFSWWDFSKNVKSYFRAWSLKNWKPEIENLINDINKRWDVNKMKQFEEYSKTDFPSKSFSANSVLEKLKQDSVLDTSMENIDNSLLDNPIVVNSWWILSNINVVQKLKNIDRSWNFVTSSSDELGNTIDFWEQVTKEVNAMNVNNDTKGINNIKLLLRQYCKWFNLYDSDETYRWLKTAYYRKDKMWHSYLYPSNFWNKKYKDGMGLISKNEIDSILWYTFKWKVMSRSFQWYRLPKEMHNVLNAFQHKFEEAFWNWLLKRDDVVEDVFNIWNKENIKPLWLWSWSMYNRAVKKWEAANYDDTDWDSIKAKRNRVRNNFNSWNFINYYIANIEESFRNLSSNEYIPVTISKLDNLMDQIEEENYDSYNKTGNKTDNTKPPDGFYKEENLNPGKYWSNQTNKAQSTKKDNKQAEVPEVVT